MLNLAPEQFFEQFNSLFSHGVKNGWYQMKDIAEFFAWIKSADQLFGQYISCYSSNVDTDDLWNMLIHLYKTVDINDIIQNHLFLTLKERIPSVTVLKFLKYTKSTKKSLEEIKIESFKSFVDLFEKIFDVYIIQNINNPRHSYQFNRTDYHELLQNGLEIFSTDRLVERPSCLLLIRKVLFEVESLQMPNTQRLKNLFENLKDFKKSLCEKYTAEKIIDDECLKDFLITNISIWLKLGRETYKYLCENHENNPWTIYIWTRIIDLSFSKILNNNHIDILIKINDWMKDVQHDIYNPTDILTIILVIKLFELALMKYSRSILMLPYINIIMSFIISMRDNTSVIMNVHEIDNFLMSGKETIYEILRLKAKCSLYRELLNDSIIFCFVPLIDINNIVGTIDRQQYRFLLTSENIDDIVALPKPNDIDFNNIRSNEEFFHRFIKQINEWFNWFDRFVDIFQHIIDWLKTHNVNRSSQLLIDLLRTRDDPKITLIEMRTIIDSTLKLLQPFKDLRRLCQLFNCLIPFQIINPGTLFTQDNTTKFLTELKRFQANHTFTVEGRNTREQSISIIDRQQIQWSLASEKYPCDVTVEYRSHGANNQYKTLYQQQNVSIHKHVLHGQFESQRNGQLLITIDNKNDSTPRIIWYRIKCMGISTSHLFHGIFKMHFDKYYQETSPSITENDFSKLLNQVFDFINKLLIGDISLRSMTELQAIFKDKNINIREEVKKLYINRSNQQNNNRVNMPDAFEQVPRIQPNENEIEQVCEWLQIYQYYSHLNVIMECIEKFDLLPLDNEEAKIGRLKHLSGNENCSLKDIGQDYKILQECFQTLTHQHLQLIKTAVKCSNVIQMMKKSDLYSQHGRRRFQELRDNLTTQFQLQELNNMILNSWIITYALIEPFMLKANNFDDFILRLADITNLEESSLNHIKVVNDNIQLVTLWLSAEETTVLDNALITMEHLYKSGTVDIHLQRLTRKKSYYEIGYSIDRIQVEMQQIRDENNQNEQGQEDNIVRAKQIQFQLTISDIDDHKRQLTFCNVDVQQNLIYKKALINGQLKLLQIIENIYNIFTK
ncbi:unnamed protein product, partial [Rotaria sp. Silwood2]